jgi:hypothetical protein
MRHPRVEILYFEGCPSHEAARALVARVAAELGLQADFDVVEVSDADAAVQRRFLGSPSVRVEGRDVEPGAGDRSDFVLSCRVYRTGHGLSGVPAAEWVREALRSSVA